MPRSTTSGSTTIEGLEARTLFAGTPAELIAQAIDRMSEEATQKLLERSRIAATSASQTAFAEFDSVDTAGKETFAQVLATKDNITDANSTAALTLAVRDTTTNTPLLAAFGSSPLGAGTTARIDEVSRAAVAGTLTETDAAALESFPASFNVQWKGTGKTTASHVVDIQDDTVTITLTQSRAATAGGLITSPGTTVTPLSGNLTPLSATQATLDSTVVYQLSISAAQKLFGQWVRRPDRGRDHSGPVECPGGKYDGMKVITGKLSDMDGASRRSLANELLSKLAGYRR